MDTPEPSTAVLAPTLENPDDATKTNYPPHNGANHGGDDRDRALEILEAMLALRSGTSAYVWEPEGGLGSLRETGLNVPGSKRITDALRYVAQSMHFGIYLFTGFADQLKPADTVMLRRISRMETSNQRKLVFVANHVELPEELDGLYDRIAAEASKPARLHLRDGRWVE